MFQYFSQFCYQKIHNYFTSHLSHQDSPLGIIYSPSLFCLFLLWWCDVPFPTELPQTLDGRRQHNNKQKAPSRPCLQGVWYKDPHGVLKHTAVVSSPCLSGVSYMVIPRTFTLSYLPSPFLREGFAKLLSWTGTISASHRAGITSVQHQTCLVYQLWLNCKGLLGNKTFKNYC